MSRIICAIFDRTVDAEAALEDLKREGFQRTEVDAFYVSPPGQHDMTPVGGDASSSEGSRGAGHGAITGAAIGAAAGALAGWAVSWLATGDYGVVAIPLGAGLGAYVGSFAGSMVRVRSGNPAQASVEHPVEPRGGRMIALNVDRPGTERRAIEVLQRHRGRDLRRAEGRWADGSWRDFDPRAPLAAV